MFCSRRTAMLMLLTALTPISLVRADENTLSPKEKQDGWRLLFDGRTLDGWIPEGDGQWRVADGTVVCDQGGDGWLRTKETYEDFQLHCDFRNIPQGNSGLFLRAANKGSPYPAPEHGYELQINNEEPKFATGSIEDYIQRLKPVTPTPNEWHSFDVEARGPHFIVHLDGVKVLDGQSDKFKAGYIGLQFHKDSKIEFRNIKLKVLQK